MPSGRHDLIREYAAGYTAIRASGQGTSERSYYTEVNNLLRGVGEELQPAHTTLPEPAAIEGGFPDVALYEEHSQVLTLPVEVKPATVSRDQLLSLEQGRRYARQFGGGHVLVTNLREYVWAELDGDQLIERDAVTVLSERGRTESIVVDGEVTRKLVEMLQAACSHRAIVRDPDLLARLLAYHASQMLEAVHEAGDPTELLAPLAEAMREGLGMQLEDEFFASTIVQTLIYGLFSAWLDRSDPQSFSWQDAGYLLRMDVAAELFGEISKPAFVRACDLRLELEATARVLSFVDRPAFGAQFDDYAIEYFYEPFLARFDPDLRDKLGVWYTPREIATYQVRRIDKHLREDLGIVAGLADEDVVILDPACGTGTYLRAVIDHIRAHHLANNEPPEVASQRAQQAALNRLVGFEVLPAAFVIGHLHLGRHLAEIGAPLESDQRLRIYLTNSLTGWQGGEAPRLPLPGLTEELEASRDVKESQPVLVILGNPPYEGYSAAETEEEQELLDVWIEPLWREYGVRKHRLGDLYVRFWRVAVRKIAEMVGQGVISFISNRKWLGGRSFPAMRHHIVHAFDRVVVDDLGGDTRTGTGGGSVFTTSTATGIQVGVAITTVVRSTEGGDPATVQVRNVLEGSGAAKRGALESFAGSMLNAGLEEHQPSRRHRWKLIESSGGDAPLLDEYFKGGADVVRSGVQVVRSPAVFDFDEDKLRQRMSEYFDPDIEDEELKQRHPTFDQSETLMEIRQAATRREMTVGRIVPFLFKPFDRRFIYWDTELGILHRARSELFPYFLKWEKDDAGDEDHLKPVDGQLAIATPQTSRRPSGPRSAVTAAVPSFEATDPNARVLTRLAPPEGTDGGPQLELDDGGSLKDQGDDGYTTNITETWLGAGREAGLTGTDNEVGDVLFFSLIAVMHSPSWLDFVGGVHDDFVPVPLPSDSGQLHRGWELGYRIATLCDLSTEVAGVTTGPIEDRWASIAIPDHAGRVRLTAGGTQRGGDYHYETSKLLWSEDEGWRNVLEAVWEYEIGGFQVLPKWLGYRHHDRYGRVLSPSEVQEVTSICRRIAAILDLQDDCDGLFDAALENTLEPPA